MGDAGILEQPQTYETLGVLGCGTIGTAILKGLVEADDSKPDIKHVPAEFIACVRSNASLNRLNTQFLKYASRVKLLKNKITQTARNANILLLGCKPHMVRDLISSEGFVDAIRGKVLISIAAGWTRKQLETALYGSETTLENANDRCWVVRAMPNTAAYVSESMTAIELSEPELPQHYLHTVTAIFSCIGKVVFLPAKLMDASTAICGSTPAFFAIFAEALIDGAVATGVPRPLAQVMTYQALKGTVAMLQGGEHPAILKEKCTSPGGCTIEGVISLEEAGVRGLIAKALREATSIAGLLGEGREQVIGTR